MREEVSTSCGCVPHYRCTDFVTPRYVTDGTVDKCDQCKDDARDAQAFRDAVKSIKLRLELTKGNGVFLMTLQQSLELLGAA